MDFAIEFGGDPQDMTITISGSAELAGFNRINKQIVSDPRFRPGMMILVDNSALDPTPLSAEEVREAEELLMEHDWNFPPKAMAIVVSDQHAFELADRAVARASVVEAPRRVFRSRDEALAWLREQKSLQG